MLFKTLQNQNDNRSSGICKQRRSRRGGSKRGPSSEYTLFVHYHLNFQYDKAWINCFFGFFLFFVFNFASVSFVINLFAAKTTLRGIQKKNHSTIKHYLQIIIKILRFLELSVQLFKTNKVIS